MLIYDLEILKAIKSGDIPANIEGIEYCDGWTDHAGMGISVIGAYDYNEDRYRVFTRETLRQFQDLINQHDWIVGFNSVAFDNNVCMFNRVMIPPAKNYDILREIWRAAGLSPSWGGQTHLGYSLDECARVNFKEKKSGNGGMAPIQWQRGEYGTVIDYCLQDVRLTKKLLDKIIYEGWILNPKGPGRLHLPMPGLHEKYL